MDNLHYSSWLKQISRHHSRSPRYVASQHPYIAPPSHSPKDALAFDTAQAQDRAAQVHKVLFLLLTAYTPPPISVQVIHSIHDTASAPQPRAWDVGTRYLGTSKSDPPSPSSLFTLVSDGSGTDDRSPLQSTPPIYPYLL